VTDPAPLAGGHHTTVAELSPPIARASAGAPGGLAAPAGEAAGHDASIPEALPPTPGGAAVPAARATPIGTAIATTTATALTMRTADPIRLLPDPSTMTTQSRTEPQRL